MATNASAAEDEQQRHAADDGRQHERDGDERAHHPPTGELDAGQ
jgi:hypothetical protein